MDVDALLRQHGADACIGCGRCTYGCPAAHRHSAFSPRLVVERLASGGRIGEGLWSCVACGACAENCPEEVDFRAFVLDARRHLRSAEPPLAAHHGILGLAAGLSSRPSLRPASGRWVSEDLALDPASPTLLFVGCTPYFDVVFRDFRTDLLEIPRSAVRLLNALGVRPRLLAAERCCGHDAYWQGDEERFEALAEQNIEAIAATGVEEVITFCPECYTTLHDLYPKTSGRLPFRVRNLTAMLGEAAADGRLQLATSAEPLTYQDPCQLSKQARIVDQPREVLRRIGELRDMPRSGRSSLCCGTAGWVNCDASVKRLQKERLTEAAATAATCLVTACPKCLVHLSCAAAHHGDEIPHRPRIEDLHVLAARSLKH